MVKLVGAFSVGLGISSYVKFLGAAWSDSCSSQCTKGCPCGGQQVPGEQSKQGLLFVQFWGQSRAVGVCPWYVGERRTRWELHCAPAGPAVNQLGTSQALGTRSCFPAQPQLWQHSLAGAGVEPRSCRAARGGCVCPRAPGLCEWCLWLRLPAQHHLLSLGSAVLTPWDNVLSAWSVSRWGWVGRTQACVVFLWDSLGLRKGHLKVQNHKQQGIDQFQDQCFLLCPGRSGVGCSMDYWERWSAVSTSENVAQALALVNTSRCLWIIRVFFSVWFFRINLVLC